LEYRLDGVENVEYFGSGEVLRVPMGVEHRPVAKPGTETLIFERESVINAGAVVDEHLADAAVRI